jgi:hypothetical protein
LIKAKESILAGVWKSVYAVREANSGRAMDQRVIIARLNIEHYRRKLATEDNDATRQRIMCLLAEEEAKLAALSDAPGKEKEKG